LTYWFHSKPTEDTKWFTWKHQNPFVFQQITQKFCCIKVYCFIRDQIMLLCDVQFSWCILSSVHLCMFVVCIFVMCLCSSIHCDNPIYLTSTSTFYPKSFVWIVYLIKSYYTLYCLFLFLMIYEQCIFCNQQFMCHTV